MALDSKLVEAIHARLLVRYGARWTNFWQGVPPEMVRNDWAGELHGVPPTSIAYALENLPPDYPPTVAQFRALCIAAPAAPRQQMPLLDAPKPDPERMKAILRRWQELAAERKGKPLLWAEELRDREKRGEELSEVQRAAWRKALDSKLDYTTMYGEFHPVDPACLPPGMRDDFHSTREAA